MKKEQRHEIEFYEELGNWDFSDIECEEEKLTDWDFYETIRENSDSGSLALDLGTGAGEKLLESYPEVGMVIGTDLSGAMIKTAKENKKKFPGKRVKFVQMDNLEMTFPAETFDIVSARHTIIDAKQIYDVLVPNGSLVIQGIDKEDCWEIKELFGRGQGFKDKMAISEKDYQDLVEVGFSKIERFEIFENEYYKTREDLLALLLKTPILDDFSEENPTGWNHRKTIENDLFEEYVRRYQTDRGILLKRRLYGIVAKK
ncbi:MAG: methyltransferase domain-containing protein [Clostridia bacterium]|nr:methyltransferase domain-containing protein [Clostridia bacterium]